MWASITDPSIGVRIRMICCSVAWMKVSRFTNDCLLAQQVAKKLDFLVAMPTSISVSLGGFHLFADKRQYFRHIDTDDWILSSNKELLKLLLSNAKVCTPSNKMKSQHIRKKVCVSSFLKYPPITCMSTVCLYNRVRLPLFHPNGFQMPSGVILPILPLPDITECLQIRSRS